MPGQGFPAVCSRSPPGVPGKLCHPRHFRFPGECLPRVCWNVCPGSCREKQALMALGLLLATLWGGDEECGGIGTCPLPPTGSCSGLQHFSSPCVTWPGRWLHTLCGCPAVCPSHVVNRYKYIKIYIIFYMFTSSGVLCLLFIKTTPKRGNKTRKRK